MKLVVGNVRWRLLSLMRSTILAPLPNASALPRDGESRDVEDRYRITRFRTLTRRIVRVLPPVWREWAAECFLRRANAPGPAAEHIVQYLLSAAKSQSKIRIRDEATVAKGADNFYERQYRQYFNSTMGAFAMTATQALLASGGPSRGLLWWRRRKTYAAMVEEIAGAPPIMVIDRETAAVPLLLPPPVNQQDRDAIGLWLGGHGSMPSRYRELVAGEEVHCAEPHVLTRERVPTVLFSKWWTAQFTAKSSLCWCCTRMIPTPWGCISPCSRWKYSNRNLSKKSMASPPMLSSPGGRPPCAKAACLRSA